MKNVRGKVKFFNEEKGFGFFVPDDGSRDVFIHRSSLPLYGPSLTDGLPVIFDIETGPRGRRAVNVVIAHWPQS